MRFSNRSVNKAIRKLRNGRDITSSELVIINRHHRKIFYLSKWARMATSVACNVAQVATVASQPMPADSEHISDRMIKALKTVEIAIDLSEHIARIASEVFKPNKKQAYIELYSEKKRAVGNYSMCSDIKAPLETFMCREIPNRRSNYIVEGVLPRPKSDWIVEILERGRDRKEEEKLLRGDWNIQAPPTA